MSVNLDSKEFVSRLEEIAPSSGRPVTELRAEARRDLAEMSGQRSPLAIWLFALLSRLVYRRGYRHEPIYDLDETERVRAECGRRSVVFLVTHKTYLDFFVLFDFLYRQGIPTPFIFGGLNMNFAGFGGLARRAGGIFIRRSFRDAPVYKTVLRYYIESLIREGSCFMWAIEGTRSRTGKLVIPRLGLLTYVGDISRGLGIDAIGYIPVSVTYDQIPDVIDMAAEEAGARKPRENLSWFVRYVRRLGGPFGQIHIRFGDAMALHDTPDAPDLDASRQLLGEEQVEIQKLAFEACYRINEITPATLTSLVLLALLCRGRSAAEELSQDVAALGNTLVQMGGRVNSSRPSRRLSPDPWPDIQALMAAGVIAMSGKGRRCVLYILPEKISVAVYYSNMAVHHFVIPAIAEAALLATAQCPAGEARERFQAECMRLRKLFQFEFFFSRKDSFREQLRRELSVLHPRGEAILELGSEALLEALGRKPLLVAAGVLSPFVSSYRLVAEKLVRDTSSSALNDEEFIAGILQQRNGMESPADGAWAPGVSRALLLNGLRVADNRALRSLDDPRALDRRLEFLRELEATAGLLATLQTLSRARPGADDSV